MPRIRRIALCAALLLAAAIHPLAAQAPGSVESYLKEARTAMEAKSYWMAAIQLRQAVALAPNHGEAHLLLGAALASDGRWDEARPFLERAAQLDTNLRAEAGRWLDAAPGGTAPSPAPATPPASAPAQPTTAPAAAFRVGDAVEVEHVKDVWRAGVVTRVLPGGCATYTVRYSPHGKGEALLPVTCGSIRAPTGRTTPYETAASSGMLVLGDYACDYRPNLNSPRQQKGTVSLLAGGQYRYLDEKGSFRYDRTTGAITWLSGPLADRSPERTTYRRNQRTTQLDIRFGPANEWSCGHNL
jgi:tetratricopeptide (TPR) repeat protein